MKRDLMILILFSVVLILAVVNFEGLLDGFLKILRLFSPLFTGIALAFILNKPSTSVQRVLSKIPFLKKRSALTRGLSIFVVYVAVLFVTVVFVSFVIPELIDSIQILIKTAGNNMWSIQQYVDRIADFFNIESIDLSKVGTLIMSSIKDWGSSVATILNQVINITTGVISGVAKAAISLVFSVYLLFGKDKFIKNSKRVFSVYIPEKIYNKCEYVMRVVIDSFDRYVVGQLTEACILGVLCFVGMVILRFEYPLLISVLIGVTALVPVVGAYIGGIISAILLLIISPARALWFVIFLIILQQFEGNVIYPRVVGSSLGLPSIFVLLSVIIGGGVAGPAGILLGVPITAILYTLLKNDIARRDEA
jgi:predicted PurR-regulated permease PerM